MAANDPVTEQLLQRALGRDDEAVAELMAVHRPRVRKMVQVRLDRRLAARVDPSDVVQETLIEATRRLPEYLRDPRVAFYPWLRELAMNRLVDLHRRHVTAKRRSVLREEQLQTRLPDASRDELARRLVASTASPSKQMERKEQAKQVRQALGELAEGEREVLVLKYLEGLTAAEIADVVGITERTVWRRHRKAIEELGAILGEGQRE